MAADLVQRGNLDAVDAFLRPFFPEETHKLMLICATPKSTVASWRLPGMTGEKRVPVITQEVEAHMRHIRRVDAYEAVIDATLKHVEPEDDAQAEALAHHLRNKRDWFYTIGFWQMDHLAKLSVWEAMLGPDFLERYDNGEIYRILGTSSDAWIAIERIRRHLEGEPQPGAVHSAEEI
ncbi:MAG: hypothetical protein AAFP87_07920 [Pseudomonadota bacterium]